MIAYKIIAFMNITLLRMSTFQIFSKKWHNDMLLFKTGGGPYNYSEALSLLFYFRGKKTTHIRLKYKYFWYLLKYY